MAKAKKMFLSIYAGYIVFVLLVVLGMFLYRRYRMESDESKITDPATISKLVNEMVNYDLPPGHKEIFARQQSTFNTVFIGPEKGKGGVIIAFMQPKESSEDLSKVIEKGIDIGFFFDQLDFSAVGDTTLSIKSKSEIFSISKGLYKGMQLKKIDGFFDGNRSRAYLLMVGFSDDWENFDISHFLNSIR